MQTALENLLWLLGPAGLIVMHAIVFGVWARRLLPFILLLDVVAVLLCGTGLFVLPLFDAWMAEDAWAEWATFFSFFGVAPLIAFQLWREKKKGVSLPYQSLPQFRGW